MQGELGLGLGLGLGLALGLGLEKFLLEMCKVRPGPRVGCARYTPEMCKRYPKDVQGTLTLNLDPNQPGGRPQAVADVLADNAHLRDALPRPAGYPYP